MAPAWTGAPIEKAARRSVLIDPEIALKLAQGIAVEEDLEAPKNSKTTRRHTQTHVPRKPDPSTLRTSAIKASPSGFPSNFIFLIFFFFNKTKNKEIKKNKMCNKKYFQIYYFP